MNRRLLVLRTTHNNTLYLDAEYIHTPITIVAQNREIMSFK